MNKKTLQMIAATSFILGAAILIYRPWSEPENVQAGAYDEFAQCLSQKGATMYGAYWCSHCKNEKEAFGTSFQYVNYVECTQDPQRCTNARVNGYPTWIFPDGRRFEGEQGLVKLAEASGCSLPAVPQ